MRLVAAILMLGMGFSSPLLLNGQSGVNCTFGFVCAAAAVALAIGPAWGAKSNGARQLVGWFIVAAGVLIAVTLLVQLPAAYRSQREFNRMKEQLRTRVLRAPDIGPRVETERTPP